MFKNSPSICYIFFAVDDVMVMSVNTYTSIMGISTVDKYLIKCLPENKKYGAKWLLKCFLTKTGVLVDWKRWSLKKLMTRYCCLTYWVVVDLALSAQYLRCHFLISAFSPSRLPFLLGNSLSNRFAPYFLFSRKDLMKYLSSVLIPIIDV